MGARDNFIASLLDVLLWAFIVSMAISVISLGPILNGETKYLALSIGGFFGSGVGFCVAVIAKHTHASERH